MSDTIQIFSDKATELLDLVMDTMIIQDLFDPELDEGNPEGVPVKSYIMMEVMAVIYLDSEEWVSLDYIDIEKITNEIVVRFNLQFPAPRKSWL